MASNYQSQKLNIMKKYLIHVFVFFLFSSITLVSLAQQNSNKRNTKSTTSISAAAPVQANEQLNVQLEQVKQNTQLLRGQALGRLNGLNYTLTTNSNDCETNFDGKDLKTKEISMEINASKTAEIFIENSSRTIEVKTWDNSKVKVTTTVYFQGEDSKLSDEIWFEKLNISFKSMTNLVRIKSGLVGGGNYAWSNGSSNGVAVFDAEGQNIGTKNNVKRIVTIYVPKENKLDVETKYADVNLIGNYNKLNAEITNGNLEIENVKDLILRSKYSNVSIAKVNLLEAEFINGRLSITEINEADLDTKYSTVEIGSADKLSVKSSNDEYEIEDLGSIVARKNYGNLRITKLKNSIEIDGTNADIKIRNIDANITIVKIDNKYADLRLPMRNVKNYTVEYNGPYSTIYSNFEKKPMPAEPKKANEDVVTSTIRSVNKSIAAAYSSEDDCGCNDRFKATVGDGKGAKVEIKCQNCTVDFK
jgi:hypothetical protein